MLHFIRCFCFGSLLPADDRITNIDRLVKGGVEKLPDRMMTIGNTTGTGKNTPINPGPNIVCSEIPARCPRPFSIPGIDRMIFITGLHVEHRFLRFEAEVLFHPPPWIIFPSAVSGLQSMHIQPGFSGNEL